MRTRQEQLELSTEISGLQTEIALAKKKNRNERLDCNIRRLKARLKKGFVLVAVPIAGTVISSSFGWSPFKLNDQEISAVLTTTIDRDGNETKEKEYSKEKPFIDVTYYSKWEETDNGNFEREKCVYHVKEDKDISNVLLLIEDDDKITKERVRELLTNKLTFSECTSETEYTPVLDKKYGSDAYVEAVVRLRDKTDTITRTESITRHHVLTGIEFATELIITIIIVKILKKHTFFYEHANEAIKRTPKYIDTSDLEKKLDSLTRIFNDVNYQFLPEGEEQEDDESEHARQYVNTKTGTRAQA